MAKEKILFADDNAAVVKLVSTFLKVNDFEVFTAVDGQTAYELANQVHPDLIISDVMMPKKSGFDLCRDLRENALTWHIPVLLLSAKDQTADKVQGLEEGADDYMTKPFELDELLARIKALLKRSQEAMDANPSTKLPGNISIEKAIVKRINAGSEFAVCYCDLDNFKAFNDHYGFYLGDRAIKFTGQIINETVRGKGNPEDFVGHIGGDDFIFITHPNRVDELCQAIIQRFDKGIRDMYDETDLKRGYITSKNRQGITVESPIMSISIAAITNVYHKIEHPGQISMIEGELKEFVKKMEGSNFIIDKMPDFGRENNTIDEILIAHHDREYAHQLKKSLRGFPFSITLARNGAETILYVLEKEPALLIVDPELDVIDGSEVFQILRKKEQYQLLPILFFATRENYDNIKGISETMGVNGILMRETKPQEVASFFSQILEV